MFCEKCGHSLSDGAAFCPKCGNPVASAAKNTGNSSVSQTVPGSQSPMTGWQTSPGNQDNNGNQPSKSSWKPIAVIGGIVLCVIALIVLIVVLINNLGDGGSGSKRNNKNAVSENEDLLLGEWTSRKDSTFGADFPKLMVDTMIETYEEYDPDAAEAMDYYYGDYTGRELLELFGWDEPTEIVLDFKKKGDIRIKMYDEWADEDEVDLSFSYKVIDEETLKLTCIIPDEEFDVNIVFSYEAEYKVDEDSLTLDFFGNTVKFDRE